MRLRPVASPLAALRASFSPPRPRRPPPQVQVCNRRERLERRARQTTGTTSRHRDQSGESRRTPDRQAGTITRVGGSCGVGWATDGGRTAADRLAARARRRPAASPVVRLRGGCDPSVGFLNDGTAVFTCNAWSNKKPTARSVTTSRGWRARRRPRRQRVASAETKAGRNLDHPMMTIDHYKRPRAGSPTRLGAVYQANSYALVSDSDCHRLGRGPFRIAADYKANAPDVFDVSLAGAPDGTICSTAGDLAARAGVERAGRRDRQPAAAAARQAFARSVAKVRDLVPAPTTLPGESWRTSMQARRSARSTGPGTVYELTGDFVTGHLHMYLAEVG